MKRTFNITVALLLFTSGLWIAWTTYAIAQMFEPIFGPPPWTYWSTLMTGAVLSLSSVALFRWRRPAAIIGSLTSLALAAQFYPAHAPNTQMPSEYGTSVILLSVGLLVYWRFVTPASCGSAIA